jgi:heme/copper-type cytochrome/quinol oxidase subunit 2
MQPENKIAPPWKQEESPLRTVLLLFTWIIGMVVGLGVFAFVCYVLIQ